MSERTYKRWIYIINLNGIVILTENVETTQSGDHWTCINLTHVATPVGFLELTNVQLPRSIYCLVRYVTASRKAMLVRRSSATVRRTANTTGTTAGLESHRDTVVVRDCSGVHREDRLVWRSKPTDLQFPTIAYACTSTYSNIRCSADQPYFFSLRSVVNLNKINATGETILNVDWEWQSGFSNFYSEASKVLLLNTW